MSKTGDGKVWPSLVNIGTSSVDTHEDGDEAATAAAIDFSPETAKESARRTFTNNEVISEGNFTRTTDDNNGFEQNAHAGSYRDKYHI